ncbi:unnamed protein product [Mytilus edulis]|uniref:Uncharacterized protein n=1 Tax=Mytilus edulis TaxID=6550 RepID=A0A8S3VIA6_MYTED|nr:unnamed protein product [Mytilus edulis]
MGTIILDTKSSDATLTSRKIKQAQIMVPTTHVPVIDDLKLTLRQTVKIEDSQKLVVTSGSDTSITIIDMKNRKTEKSINVGSSIYGIVHKDGKLFYNGCTSGLCVVSLDDDSITQLVNDTLSRHSSIIIWSDQLYYINDDSVTCCDLSGTFKWRLELASFLKRARGITVDNHGRVYVSGFHSHNVVVISPDGNKHKVLLSQKDNIFWPQTLFLIAK